MYKRSGGLCGRGDKYVHGTPLPLAPPPPALRGHEDLGGRWWGGGHFGLWLSEPLGRRAKGLGALRRGDGAPQIMRCDLWNDPHSHVHTHTLSQTDTHTHTHTHLSRGLWPLPSQWPQGPTDAWSHGGRDFCSQIPWPQRWLVRSWPLPSSPGLKTSVLGPCQKKGGMELCPCPSPFLTCQPGLGQGPEEGN